MIWLINTVMCLTINFLCVFYILYEKRWQFKVALLHFSFYVVYKLLQFWMFTPNMTKVSNHKVSLCKNNHYKPKRPEWSKCLSFRVFCLFTTEIQYLSLLRPGHDGTHTNSKSGHINLLRYLRQPALAVSTETPPTCCSNLPLMHSNRRKLP